MDEKQHILDIIKKYPKHYSKMIQNRSELKNWVIENTLIYDSNFAAQVYSAISQTTNGCKNSKSKKFINISTGWGFCGRSKECLCCADSVSNNVSKTKAEYSDDAKAEINEKRKRTTLAKYGVSNNGQIPQAKLAHKNLYQDLAQVAKITEGIKQTKLESYGDENYNNRAAAEQTCIERYKVKNTWLLRDDTQNPNLVNLQERELLEQVFPKHTVDEIAKMYNVHQQTVYRYLNLHGLREPYKSTFEQEIIFFLNSLGITNILSNKRSIIGKELDIFLPDYNLAIEFNGVVWHHDEIPHITKTYHYDKFIRCEQKEITLFTIFSNSWESKKEIWKQKIKAKLNLNDNKVYARQTQIVRMKPVDTREILNKHHVQGYCSSQYCYGLSFNSVIVAVMTFSKKRAGIGKQRDEESYELVRYVTSINVVGGASKLLTHFIRNHSPNLVFSYSDNQYSTGNMYKQLGFALEKENKCGYWYYDPLSKKSYHRYNFTKHKLISDGFPADKTEKEIMNARGFMRIWDCGSRTWVLRSR